MWVATLTSSNSAEFSLQQPTENSTLDLYSSLRRLRQASGKKVLVKGFVPQPTRSALRLELAWGWRPSGVPKPTIWR